MTSESAATSDLNSLSRVRERVGVRAACVEFVAPHLSVHRRTGTPLSFVRRRVARFAARLAATGIVAAICPLAAVQAAQVEALEVRLFLQDSGTFSAPIAESAELWNVIIGNYNDDDTRPSSSTFVRVQVSGPSGSYNGIALWALHLAFWSSVGLAVAAWAWSVDESPSFKHYAQVFGLFSAVALALRLALEAAARKATVDAYRRADPLRVELSLLPDGIEVQYHELSLKARWSSIRATTQDDRNLYLHFEAGSALPVPKQAPPEVVSMIAAKTTRFP